MMRSFGLALAALLCLSGMAVAEPLIGIDEKGTGFIQNPSPGGPVTFLTAVKGPDPGPGGLPSTLIYSGLPFAGVQGDVGLTDAGVLNDVIRFNGNGTIIFYSDNLDGADDPADTPSPPGGFYGNFLTLPEIGPEGNNGATYTPLPGQPGFDPANPGTTYRFQSDGAIVVPAAVPEPASITLLGAGLGGAGLLNWVRRRRAARHAG